MASSIGGENILIVGAGLSGLLLAQILRKADIAFEVFERDSGTRAQGWSVALDKSDTSANRAAGC
jgi:2-polyprenyl-6-methoxyphenol hydroxylase-like FAD-dependent oxidoreductase